MALNQNNATLPKTPFSRMAVVTAAETSFHSPTAGNLQELLAPADNVEGARVTRLYAIPRAAVGTANHLQLYKKVGSTYTLLDSILQATVSPGASAAAVKTDFGYSLSYPLELEAGEGLAVGMGQAIANGVAFRCEGGFYAQ